MVRIKFTMQGLPSDAGYVRLSDFLAELENLKSVLQRARRVFERAAGPGMSYRIVGLSTSSPATVEIEAFEADVHSQRPRAVVDHAFSVLADVDEGRVPQRADYTLFENIRNLTAPIGKTLQSATLSSNGTTIELTPAYKAKVDLLMAPEEMAPSFVRGMLEYINIHGPQKVFRIYPVAGPPKITCHFPEGLKQTAIAAIGAHVEVRGTFKYKSIARFPHEVDVREIVVLPHDDIPRFQELLGAAPELTGGMSSVEFVRTIRHGQE